MGLRISIITPCLNHGRFIKDNIESVLDQHYENIEHIIIDGLSTDNTLEILAKYSHLKWISEKDNGPVDAINKGFRMASGDVLAWVNADDYLEKDVIKDVVQAFSEYKNVEVVVGFLKLIDLNDQLVHYNNSISDYNKTHLVRNNPDIVRQPSTFFTKKIFERVGGFDPKLRLGFDYDLFIKMFSITNPVFVEKNFAYQRIYDETLTRKSLRKQVKEMIKISRRNGGKITDPINKLALKRYIFPSLFNDKKTLPVKLFLFFRNLLVSH